MTASSILAIDASVAVKWFAPEIFTEQALALPNRYLQLIAPDLIVAEVTSALLKKIRRGEVVAGDVHVSIDLLVDRVLTWSTLGMEHDAFDMAHTNGCSVYDSLYVALALQEGCQLVTADEKLYNALSGVYPETMLWLGDVRPESAL